MAINAASLESLTPIDAANMALMIPYSYLKTPPILTAPGFPFDDPSTFHFRLLCGGGYLVITGLCTIFGFHDLTQSRLFATSRGLYGHF